MGGSGKAAVVVRGGEFNSALLSVGVRLEAVGEGGGGE